MNKSHTSKNVLIYTTALQGAQESLQIDEAIEQNLKGNNVYFIHCDESIGGCNDNPNFNRSICKFCVKFQKKLYKSLLPESIKVISVKELLTEDSSNLIKKDFNFHDYESLQNLTYKDVEIGMGCLSSYISLTRNINPLIDIEAKAYFDQVLHSEVKLTNAIYNFLSCHQIDLIVFHNGRYAQYKPLLNIAQKKKINYVCTEAQRDREGKIKKNYFYNTIPHDISINTDRINLIWEHSKEEERVRIGKEFFERKRNKKGTGDKVYVENQIYGKLTDNWDRTKENIVIFNSSEDEYCAIGKDFDKRKFFASQLQGITTILEHYKHDKSKHFYLRIHPNLKDIPYKYHTNLYNLQYDNFTVISGNSSISSYALIDNANKIITFGSTIGAEAAYVNKPVINLGPAMYNELNFTYIPKDINELWGIIDIKNLKGKYNINVLKYGYYYMALYYGLILHECKNINNDPVNFTLFGKNYIVYTYQQVLGSNFLYLLCRRIIKYIFRNFSSKIKIPYKES